jgi:hypothetical protein
MIEQVSRYARVEAEFREFFLPGSGFVRVPRPCCEGEIPRDGDIVKSSQDRVRNTIKSLVPFDFNQISNLQNGHRFSKTSLVQISAATNRVGKHIIIATGSPGPG